jgi:hypothetical protein
VDITTAEIIGGIAFLLGFVGQTVYIVSIFRDRTRPHLFTWLVWGILGAIGYFAQLHDHAGPGSWAMGITALACLLTAALALKWGEKNITRGDKIAFATSLFAIVPWLLMKDPIGSVILISIIDVIAFYPTLRKSWHKPYEENLTSYNLASIKMILSLFALSYITINTALYPSAVIFVNSALVAACLIRRQKLKSLSGSVRLEEKA